MPTPPAKKDPLALTKEETTLGKRIAYLRKMKRLTQRDLAEKLSVSDKLVSKWEQEESTPSIDDVVKIGELYHLSLEYLIHGKKSKDDAEALRQLPPPPPPFVDPVQTFVNEINALIEKNKWQKYREQIFPGDAEARLYALAEAEHKKTWEEQISGRLYLNPNLLKMIYNYELPKEYHEDLRSREHPIDETYWHLSGLPSIGGGDSKIRQKKLQFGVFLLYGSDDRDLKQYMFSDPPSHEALKYGVRFALDFNALLALDNFDIYTKLTALGVPLYFRCESPVASAKTRYFEGLDYTKKDYQEIFDKCQQYGGDRSELRVRNFEKVPLTYRELVGLTDLRFFQLLKKEELDLLLKKVDIKHPRVWEVVVALIDCGAQRKRWYRPAEPYSRSGEEDDPLGTLLLYEFAKQKLSK